MPMAATACSRSPCRHKDTTTLHTLSLHDALPISQRFGAERQRGRQARRRLLGLPRESGQRLADADQRDRFPWKAEEAPDRNSTRLNSSHTVISYAAFCSEKNRLLDLHGAERLKRL